MLALQLQDQQPIDQMPLVLVDLEIPQPGRGQVLIKVKTCGICHTDLHLVEGDIHPPSLPIIPGHQVVGEVVAAGPQADFPAALSADVKVGDRVGVPWLHSACGNCEFCRRDNENLCSQAQFTGFHVNGGFGEYLLADSRFVLPLPNGLTDLDAAPLLCAGIIGFRSLRLVGVQPGERIGLVGFGASAHLSLQVARHWGCEVFVFTRSHAHRQHAKLLGAAWTGGVDDPPPYMLDRAVIFAPSGALVPKILARLRPGGALAINAIYMSEMPAMPYVLLYGERILKSVTNATRQDGLDFLRLATEIGIQPTVVSFTLTEANQALQELKFSQINGEAVLVL